MRRDALRDGGEPRHLTTRVQGDFDTMTPQIVRKVRLVERAPLVDAAFELRQVEAADAPGRGFHDVEHRDMGMHLHVAWHPAAGPGKTMQLGRHVAIGILGHDHGRPRRIVVERHPAD